VRSVLSSKWTKATVFLACLSPFFSLVFAAFTGHLGINPVETLQHNTGDWSLRFLALSLCITPARKILHAPDLGRFRRTLGLYAFFYVCLHFLTYLGPDQNFSLAGMAEDVAKRPFITVGFLAFLLLIPLALTSTAGWIRRLGGKRWAQLHRVIYLIAVLGVVHYDWLVKSNKMRPLAYGAVIVLLLVWRIFDSQKRRSKAVVVNPPADA
jgi:sulfoxide reductase heme-binding subunit YedZ